MFTGIVEEVARLSRRETIRNGERLFFGAVKVMEDLSLGDSIAVNGVCQTVVHFRDGCFAVEAVGDTLVKTNLRDMPVGAPANLERACTASTRLGGHIVLGHVNGTGRVKSWTQAGDARSLEISFPNMLSRYLVAEGSVALDGISLTISEKLPDKIRLSIIPHTVTTTTLSSLKTGQAMNIEVDILAKYLESLIEVRRDGTKPGAFRESGLDENILKAWGYS